MMAAEEEGEEEALYSCYVNPFSVKPIFGRKKKYIYIF